MTMCSNVEDSIRDSIVDCLTQQTYELELLKSMYPNDGEIVVTDDYVLRDIENFITNGSQYTPSHLDFVINIFIHNNKLEICITLPTFYPKEEPDIYIRCNQLNRQQQTNLNNALSEYITKNHLGEVCLYTAISWLQENTDKFIKENNKNVIANKHKNEEKEPIFNKFVRMWIYSHHIYSKKKREEIVQRARELKLTGFCLPGKPGVICIEGEDVDCKDWWKDIKAMNWQKIVLRKTEEFDQTEQKGYQKFFKFDELIFPNPSTRSSKHADMSQFSKFMDQHGLTPVFNEIFGWCNEVNE